MAFREREIDPCIANRGELPLAVFQVQLTVRWTTEQKAVTNKSAASFRGIRISWLTSLFGCYCR